MSAAPAIARHETARLFASPLAWVLLGFTQLLVGVLFMMSLTDISLNPRHLNAYDGVSEMVGAGMFRFATLILLLVVPLLTMRAFAEERKTGTLELLLAAPASATELVLGKFAGVMIYLTLSWALIGALPATLSAFTPLDWG
ncbi:ABC transporter permease, partial [Salinisphaera sp.]|uniref:ABC transporter permease n=1 Tax=Salinisphaera sp. TaxID=1914330 RepID=UPI002D77149F